VFASPALVEEIVVVVALRFRRQSSSNWSSSLRFSSSVSAVEVESPSTIASG
jgi:hypothetical protein